MQIPLRRKLYGLNKVMADILDILRRACPDGYYYIQGRQKLRIDRAIRRIIQKELLGKELLQAISKDILAHGEIHIDSHIYRYLKNSIYHGNTRAFLGDLQDALQQQK